MWSEAETAGIGRERLFERDVLAYAGRPANVNVLLRRTVSRFPEREALVMDNRSITYKEMHGFVEHIASRLYRDYGIRKGDRVAVLLGNCIEYALIFFACSRIGAISVLLNTRLTSGELQFMLEQSGSSAVVADTEFAAKVEDFGQAPVAFLVGGERQGFVSFESLCASAEPAPAVDIGEGEPLYIMYTSGTTGLPKGAVGSHAGVIHAVISYHRIMRTTEADRSLNAVPLFHVTGLVGQMLHMVYIGGASVLVRRFRAAEFVRVLSEARITFTFNVPAVYTMMLCDESFARFRYDAVRILAYGGAAMSPQTIEQLKRTFPGVQLYNAYGATETTSPATVMPAGYQERKLLSVGLPIPVIEVKIVNHDGEICGPLQEGELLIKGPNVVQGYWDNKDANETSFEGDYWRSGDIAMMDEQGFICILDRAKDMINRGGEKIYSIEVENILLRHPDVLEAAVIGIPDRVFGESVKAVIVPKPGSAIEAAAIQAFVRLHLADYKVPRMVEVRSELPRNPGGKVLKSLLRDSVQQT
ncbi:class I adenylate-forming enzyme family protein [Paenibacillus cymbidii]|uniref:class I adenylate-forming enzyme family protein n=1 Tax=Paenibacillus cymbidii TaxID=1639034 RepID=UPI001080651C|nr:class I adenylate-forming enzyme family protein [Paenibacillus cymbidii]